METRRNSLLQIVKGRWIMAVVSLYILYCSGATYIFSVYSGALKKQLGYDQSAIDTLSFFKDLGANVGIVSGLMNEVLPSWSVLAVGAVMNVFGYVMVWMAVTHRISRPPTWQMNLYLCVGANSQTFANTGALVTVVKNFPQGRGEVLGIIKGCVGLSGAIFTQLYHAIYGSDTTGVILLIAWLPAVVTLLFMFLVRPIRPVFDRREKRTFYYFLYLALALAAFLTLAIIVQNVLNISPAVYQAFGVITVLLVIANVGVGVHAQRSLLAQEQEQAPMQEMSAKIERQQDSGRANSSSNPHDHISSSPSSVSHANHDEALQQTTSTNDTLRPTTSSLSAESPTHSRLSNKPVLVRKWRQFLNKWPQRGDDFTIPQAIFSVDMWILFISLTCGIGATLAAIDNMGQIGQSQGYSTVSIDTCVSLISIWNFLGRVIAGFLSEILLRRYRFPRTLMLTLVQALACVGHILIAFPGPATLYVASILVGLCFGAQWPLLYAIISELFGLKYYATLYNVGAIASPLGSYLLNVRVAGHFYDKEARNQQEAMQLAAVAAPAPSMAAQGELTCTGSECFKLTFVIMTIVSAFGSLVSLILVFRTRKFYSQDIYRKFHLEPEQQDIEHKTDANGMHTTN